MIDCSDAIFRIGQCLLQFASSIIDVHITTASANQYPSVTQLIDTADTRQVVVGQRDEVEGMTGCADAIDTL